MKLSYLLKDIEYKTKQTDLSIDIKCLSAIADKKMEDGLFFCYEGKTNGISYVNVAINNGAKVIICEKNINCDAIVIVVNDIRRTIGLIAQTFFGTKDVKVIGITGTNGKTTSTYLIKSILECSGKKVGLIGTNGIRFLDTFIPAKLTTPDPIDLHEILSIMQQAKVDYVVMEVSAHAIYFEKIAGINFVCKILTNVSHDHLDFFKTIQKYEQTKLGFFTSQDLMVVNADDDIGQKLINKYETAVSYGLNNPCDCFCVEINKDCSNYIMNICDNVFEVKSNLFGLFNVYNCLACATSCYFLGINEKYIKQGIENLKSVDGRFNVYKYKNNKIIIDFAHTPDGLENVLKTARNITDNKLICLFGCGGNRDEKKRKIMGAISDKYADFTYITSDNSRYEKTADIMQEISKGFNSSNFYLVEDRSQAIQLAISSLTDGDTLIICGKGAEKYMEINGEKIPYCDDDVVRRIIEGEK